MKLLPYVSEALKSNCHQDEAVYSALAYTFHTPWLIEAQCVPIMQPNQDAIATLYKTHATAWVAIDHPKHIQKRATLAMKLGLTVVPVFCFNTTKDSHTAQPEDPVDAVNHCLDQAIAQNISDVHIEPYDAHHYYIRFRRDGLLEKFTEVAFDKACRMVNHVKVLSGMNISEKRLPQDGHFSHQTLQCRVSSCATIRGEKMVIRLIYQNGCLKHNLGMLSEQQALFEAMLTQSQGMVIVTGPTGSGKTVTLYAALHFLNSVTHNILTIEDPVEINMPGIYQVQVNLKAGIDFQSTLRAFLRQDPDVIMIGEMRDAETTKIAMHASQTGHLVLSTLHTNSAIETIFRLQSLGCSMYDIASCLQLVIAQRLIRIFCTLCKGKGCDACQNSGYSGRMGVYEMLSITPEWSNFLLTMPSLSDMLHFSEARGFCNLYTRGLQLVKANVTSLTEIQRVLA
jgi:type IV pilus assembly protein PilB